MKSKRKYTCDYCHKSFVSTTFFKSSHKPTAAHLLNRGRYFESLITSYHQAQARKKLIKLSKLKGELTYHQRK